MYILQQRYLSSSPRAIPTPSSRCSRTTSAQRIAPLHNAASRSLEALTLLARHPHAAPSLLQRRLHAAPTSQQRLLRTLRTAATQGLTSPLLRLTSSPHTAATPLYAALAQRRCTPTSRCPHEALTQLHAALIPLLQPSRSPHAALTPSAYRCALFLRPIPPPTPLFALHTATTVQQHRSNAAPALPSRSCMKPLCCSRAAARHPDIALAPHMSRPVLPLRRCQRFFGGVPGQRRPRLGWSDGSGWAGLGRLAQGWGWAGWVVGTGVESLWIGWWVLVGKGRARWMGWWAGISWLLGTFIQPEMA